MPTEKRNMKKDKKKKKEKVVYYDDGSTLVEMSPLTAGKSSYHRPTGGTSRFREAWSTYVAAVRRMFVPMLITMAIISVAFLLVYLLL